MNETQKKIKDCMNEKIKELKNGLNHLKDRDIQPTGSGNLYNGMLKHSVEFEITHMEHLRDELIDLVK